MIFDKDGFHTVRGNNATKALHKAIDAILKKYGKTIEEVRELEVLAHRSISYSCSIRYLEIKYPTRKKVRGATKAAKS